MGQRDALYLSTGTIEMDEGNFTHGSNKDKSLKWVHITISNAKRNLLGVFQMMQSIYLQSYLNEFCYRLNRRYYGEKLFDRLVFALIYAHKTKNW